MAFTKVVGPGIHTLSNILSHNINSSGIITATKFVGPITGAGGDFNAGILTATSLDINGNGDISGNLVLGGNLTVNGTTTTLDTNLIDVDRVEVLTAGDGAVAVAVTHSGSPGDLVRLYDGSVQQVTVDDTGKVGLGTITPRTILHLHDSTNTRIQITDDAMGAASTDGVILGLNGQDDFFINNRESGKGIKFFTGTDDERMVINSSGDVGIHTDPARRLSIFDTDPTVLELNSTSSSGTTLRIQNNHTDKMFMGLAADFIIGQSTNVTDSAIRASGSLLFASGGGTERLRIASNGRVGVGITNPEDYFSSYNNLVVGKKSDTGGITIVSATSSGGTIAFAKGTSGNQAYRGIIRYDQSNDSLKIFTDASSIPSITCDNANQVGIGTTNPSRLLTLYGDDQPVFQITNRTSGTANTRGSIFYQMSGTSTLAVDNQGAGSGGEIHFMSAGNNNVRIESTGNTVIGNAASGGWKAKVVVPANASYQSAVNITNTVNADINFEIKNNESKISTSVAAGLVFETDNTERFRITAAGKTVFKQEIETPQDYPNFRPRLDFNFVAEKKLDPRIEYFRSGPASHYDETGKLIIVSDNVPRFDHTFPEYWDEGTLGDSDSKGEPRGLLIEETRTNLYKNNHNLTTANDHGSITQTVNTTETTAPDGTFTATKVSVSGGDQWTRWDGNNGLDLVGVNFSDAYSTSVYMKTVGTSNVNVSLDFGDAGNKTFSVGQEWKRYAITNVHVNYGGSTKFIDIVFNGDVYIWGLQCEKGSFPTSYIPTIGETETRGYEAVTLEGTDFSDIFGTDFKEFSLVADYDNTQTNDGTSYGIIDLWGEASNYDDRIEWFKDNASPYHIETRSFGQGNPTFANGNLSASSKAKSQRFATSWSVPDYSNTSSRRFVVSMGGEAVDVVNDSSGTTVPQITRMGIGCNPTRLDFSPGLLHFKRLMIYDKTLSDGQLQNLSAQ